MYFRSLFTQTDVLSVNRHCEFTQHSIHKGKQQNCYVLPENGVLSLSVLKLNNMYPPEPVQTPPDSLVRTCITSLHFKCSDRACFSSFLVFCSGSVWSDHSWFLFFFFPLTKIGKTKALSHKMLISSFLIYRSNMPHCSNTYLYSY